MRKAILVMSFFTASAVHAGEALRIGLPVDCEPGKTCWVQQYPDRDPTSGVKDYACGVQTYDGHDGTDIRVLDTTVTADVIAAAGGVVKATRDGVADRLMLTAEDREAVSKRECGNGAVIAHGDGWETQYCHLRKGSLAVKNGERVDAGTKLGLVGYSGMAAFPHVHLTVRKDGKALDPFRVSADQTSCGAGGDTLWTEDALKFLGYSKGQFLKVGFAPGRVELPALETGGVQVAPFTRDWPALVIFGWAINLGQGDEIVLKLEGPDGLAARHAVTLDRAKAQYLLFTGKTRPATGWPKGEYRGSVQVRNGPEVRLSRSWVERLN